MKRFYVFIFCLLIAPFMQLVGEQLSHAELLIKMPTRGRFDRFFETLDLYYQKLSNKVSYHFVISCDIDDPVMNSEETINKLKTYPNLSFYFEDNKSKIEACNRNIDSHLDFDVLLLASDDMIPVQDGYDEIIVSNMKHYFPDTDGVLHFNDGVRGEGLNTLSILGKNYYSRFGYIYYPEYRSFYCDDEFMQVSRLLNKVVYIDSVIIQHKHFSFGDAPIDDLYIRNDQYWGHDGNLYRQRQAINFGLPR